MKSKIDWPELGWRLPTRHGEAQGHATEGKMLAKPPAGSIRTQMRNNQDGSVTMLRTRNGWPEFTTIAAAAAGQAVTLARGFVAHVVGAAKSALFSPYDLLIKNPAYTLHNHTYTVLPFASTYNVATSDTTKWHDTISFKNGALYINAKTMPDLGMSSVTSGDYLPWLIPATGTGLEKYGAKEDNTTTKRVFAVGRYRVDSWFYDTSDPPERIQATLGGSTYRPERALAIGQRIDAESHSAWMSQLVFTGSSWDSYIGGWAVNQAEVAMLLTPPYLQKTESVLTVDQGISGLSGPVSSEYQTTAAWSLPETECCAIGVGELGSSDFGAYAYEQFQKVIFPWRDVKMHAFAGSLDTSVSQAIYTGSSSSSDTLCGVVIATDCSNLYTVKNNSEGYSFPDTEVLLFASKGGGMANSDGSVFNTQTGGTTWDTATTDGDYAPRGGNYGGGTYFHRGSNSGGGAAYTTKTQAITANVVYGAAPLVQISASRYKESGYKIVASPVTGRYATALASPYNWLGAQTGFGSGGQLPVSCYSYEPSHPNVVGKREPIIMARAAGYIGGLYYSAWDDNSADQGSIIYTSSTTERTTIDDQSLSWDTKDFILYDEANQCFISVEAHFSGAQSYGESGSADLTVFLKIDTPSGIATSEMFSASLGYTELLPEKDMGSGLTAVPSPMLRVLFTPLHQEQGGFKGAAYTTAAEVASGATPAHLFNFVLKLDTYSAIGSDSSSSPVVHFIPCNLLEMLYAFVYSTKYGVDEYERYPVDATATFNHFQNTLFTNLWRVSYCNGVLDDWMDYFGGTYASETTTELYRT